MPWYIVVVWSLSRELDASARPSGEYWTEGAAKYVYAQAHTHTLNQRKKC